MIDDNQDALCAKKQPASERVLQGTHPSVRPSVDTTHLLGTRIPVRVGRPGGVGCNRFVHVSQRTPRMGMRDMTTLLSPLLIYESVSTDTP